MRGKWLGCVVAAAVLPGILCGTAQAIPTFDWSVQYMIDESQSDFGASQATYPRDNRGLAISPDGQYLYAGYNNGGGLQQVRMIDLGVSDYIDAAVANVTGLRGKSLATDDAGRVYLAEGSSGYIKVYSADLSTELYSISAPKVEGVTTRREGGVLYLYGTDRGAKTLTRWKLTESGGGITGATPDGLDGDGVITVAGATDLRGLEVDSAGNIWMTDLDGGKVFRVDSSGGSLTSFDVPEAMDIGFLGDYAYVTQYTERTITLINLVTDSVEAETITAPWAALSLDPDGQSGYGAFSGIVMVDGGFYVTNESGQTADTRSIYGRTDASSGLLDGVFYTDLTEDDNDPIFFVQVQAAPVPLPGAVLLAMIGAGLAVIGRGVRRSS